mmetsp:Transcript_70968/g.154206  ORF Transcript_70968/g.154206 Transcript_70968/m.154206 type:complete len:251 (-) Transcript_70968:978-1730(-)
MSSLAEVIAWSTKMPVTVFMMANITNPMKATHRKVIPGICASRAVESSSHVTPPEVHWKSVSKAFGSDGKKCLRIRPRGIASSKGLSALVSSTRMRMAMKYMRINRRHKVQKRDRMQLMMDMSTIRSSRKALTTLMMRMVRRSFTTLTVLKTDSLPAMVSPPTPYLRNSSSRAAATTKRSKRFQPLQKKWAPKAASLMKSSTRKMTAKMVSMALKEAGSEFSFCVKTLFALMSIWMPRKMVFRMIMEPMV